MARSDVVAERRYASYSCDHCRKHEGHFYDQAAFAGSNVTWDSDWQDVWLSGGRDQEPLAFCSAECLTTYLNKRIGAAYPEVKVS